MRKLYLPFAMLLLGVGIAGCEGETLLTERIGQEQPLADPDCVCDTSLRFVCGSDGATYPNACAAACAGVEVVAEGECRPPEEEPPVEEPEEEPSCKRPGWPTCQQPEGGCPELTYLAPVCGVDKKTYNNREAAQCECVDILYEGECRNDWACTQDYDPVCGVDGKTYSNECTAVYQAHVPVAHNGECGPEDLHCEDIWVCLAVWWPVCGIDGKTYSNECYAGGWENVAHVGSCDCDCPDDVYEPLCVAMGHTYPNRCMVECSDVSVWYEGECEEGR